MNGAVPVGREAELRRHFFAENGPLIAAKSTADRIARGPRDAPDFIGEFKAPEYVVDELIQRNSLGAVTAHSGHGKTGFAVPLVVGVAAGQPFAGRATRADGAVVYVAAENPWDVQARAVAAVQELGVDVRELAGRLFFFEGPRSLAVLFGELAALADQVGKLALIVVDTSAATFAGDDENSNVEMQRHAEDARAMTQLPGSPAVLLLAHPRLGATRDNMLPRGASSMIAALDFNLVLLKGDADAIELSHTKMRGPPFEPIQLALRRVQLAGHTDGLGRPVTTGIVLPLAAGDDGELQRRRGNIDADNQVLRSLLAEGYVSLAKLAKACGWVNAETGEPHKWKVDRTLERLAADRLVEKFRGGYRVTKAGEAEVRKLGGLA
jgi:hypothetical protein